MKNQKKKGPESHQIIFAGQATKATLWDGTVVPVFVREMPARYHQLVFRTAGQVAELVELCTYTVAGEGESPAPRFAGIDAPHGYWPVPAGWADNVKNESLLEIYDLAGDKLNFTSAAATGKRLAAAHEWRAPLLLENEQVLQPYAEKLATLLTSSLTPLLTHLSPTGSSSSTKPSPGS
jgi:hypothetical protein